MATIEPFEGTIENAYGKALATPLAYQAEYEKLDSIVEVKAANEYPKDTDVVNFVNARRKAAARQKAMNAALAAAGIVAPTLENDDQLKLREMVKILRAAGKAETEARSIASVTLGIAWVD